MGQQAVSSSGIADLLARHDIWRGRQAGHSDPATSPYPTGWQALDAMLGGGWPREGLMELYSGHPLHSRPMHPLGRLGTGPMSDYRAWCRSSLGFGVMDVLLPLLGELTRDRGVALVNPPARLCAERWQRGGVMLDSLLLVEPETPRELGWAVEEILRSGVYPLVLAWLPPIGFALRRRLKLAAEHGGCCLFTPYPVTNNTPASPARQQLVIRREAANELAVRSLKPFHPREIRLAFSEQ
ncbi:MAG: hypothetical protein ACLFMY_01880 [Guyparkeria sp.]|uniref:hypothetical protein n=1 Tax=Guyparkeria sp. TaxID=2035736 RepID=UPI00397B5921